MVIYKSAAHVFQMSLSHAIKSQAVLVCQMISPCEVRVEKFAKMFYVAGKHGLSMM